MKLVEAKPRRLFCSTCDETYNVPQQNGSFKLHQELKCPLDEFELIYFTAGAKGKSFIFCPYCYSNPPFSEMAKGSQYLHTFSSPYGKAPTRHSYEPVLWM
jgi:DNA topoisomerase-3